MQGLILNGTKNVFEVECDDGITRTCAIKGKVLKSSENYYNPLAPGDQVVLDSDSIEEDKALICDLVPRKNEFVRWNVKKRQPQILATNLDYLLIVTTPDEPPFRPRFVDRALAQAEYENLVPIIVCNKYDLVSGQGKGGTSDGEDLSLRAETLADVGDFGDATDGFSDSSGTSAGATDGSSDSSDASAGASGAFSSASDGSLAQVALPERKRRFDSASGAYDGTTGTSSGATGSPLAQVALQAKNQRKSLTLAEQFENQLQIWENIGYRVIRSSARTGEGIEELAHLIENKLSAFVGQSGVGKSSIINVLDNNVVLKTGSLSQKYGKGCHTTTKGSLIHLNLDEALVGGRKGATANIIDTPGVRRFLLHDISPENLAFYFRDFKPFLGKCNFGMSCSHIHESGCAIKAALQSGKIAPERYESWLRIVEEMKSGNYE